MTEQPKDDGVKCSGMDEILRQGTNLTIEKCALVCLQIAAGAHNYTRRASAEKCARAVRKLKK